MRREYLVLFAAVCLSFIGRPLWAELESGPSVGDKVPELKVATITGPAEGKELDQAAERAEKPTVYLFIAADKFDRPMARFIKTLDGKTGEIGQQAHIVAVWLTADAAASKEYLPKAQQSLRLENTSLTVYPGDKAGPGAWGVNPDAHLTAVVAAGSKVAARFGYISLNETDVPAVCKAWQKTQEKK